MRILWCYIGICTFFTVLLFIYLLLLIHEFDMRNNYIVTEHKKKHHVSFFNNVKTMIKIILLFYIPVVNLFTYIAAMVYFNDNFLKRYYIDGEFDN